MTLYLNHSKEMIMKEKRGTSYHWGSKRDLIAYFDACYDMTPEQIEKEIHLVQKKFRLRKQKTIDVRDLWQKVGLSIIKKHPDKAAFYCKCKDSCEYLLGTCTWDASCPWKIQISAGS